MEGASRVADRCAAINDSGAVAFTVLTNEGVQQIMRAEPDGTLTTIRAHERGKDGKPNPTYRCLFPEPPPAGTIPACAEAGILGALPGVLGSMMALEVIREIVGFGEGLVGRLLMVDARSMRFETLGYAWDPGNPLSGDKPTIRDLSAH